MLQPLNYATPDLNRKTSAIDVIPFILGLIQSLGVLGVLATSGLGFEATSKDWYERPAQIWLSDGCMVLAYICGGSAVLIGAIRFGEKRIRFYRLYALVSVVYIALTELSVLMLSQWPGERRFRWILIHNLHYSLVTFQPFWNHFQIWLITNPALLFLAGRFINIRYRPAIGNAAEILQDEDSFLLPRGRHHGQ